MGKLVAYSGFSASNYLQQPYNSDLDFGTGDFCVMGWVKPTALTSELALFHRAITTGGIFLEVRATTGYLRLYGSASTTFSTLLTTSAGISASKWSNIVVKRDSGTLFVYIDGMFAGSVANSTDLSYANSVLRIGERLDTSGYAFNGSIALIRISATAPTAEQIAKIYEDEKVLFQEGAQATLYGSSDAVTALAYDDDTNLLHVGTSAGRSDFQGLRRVNNTTSAVGVAISASNGMIAED